MLKPVADLRGIRIECSLQEQCTLMMVVDDLYQIVFNLTENAIKYNRDGGWIGITLKREEDNILLSVADNGVGIPPESIEHIFDRFYRVDKARSRVAGGAGLGLSIVHDMVQRNYGEVCARARDEGGTEFTVTFPMFETQEGI